MSLLQGHLGKKIEDPGILADRRTRRGAYARMIIPLPGLRASADLYSSLPPTARATLSLEAGRLTRAVNEAFGPAQTIPFKDTVIGGVAVPITVVR